MALSGAAEQLTGQQANCSFRLLLEFRFPGDERCSVGEELPVVEDLVLVRHIILVHLTTNHTAEPSHLQVQILG